MLNLQGEKLGKSDHWLLNTGVFVKALGQVTKFSTIKNWGGLLALSAIKGKIHMNSSNIAWRYASKIDKVLCNLKLCSDYAPAPCATRVILETKILECLLPQ